MAVEKPIELQIINNTAVLRFIRPERKNPLSIKTLDILERKLEEIISNDNIKRIIFTGSGDTFAAGANLYEVSKLNEKTAVEFGLRGQNLMQKIYNLKQTTVAAIDGFCMGGALDLALSCDWRIATQRSIFAHPGAKLGIITGWSGTQLLPRLIGKKNAVELLVTAKKVCADEALRIGLIDLIDMDSLAKAFEINSK